MDYLDYVALGVSVLTFVISGVLAYYLSKVYGDVAGTKLAIDFERQQASERQASLEEGAVASMAAEFRRSKVLCQHNAGLKTESLAPFIRFPTTAAMRITFEDRHEYPRLADLFGDLETYTMAILHVNRLIEMHDLLWISPVSATVTDEGAQGRLGKLQRQIADLCSGREGLKGVGTGDIVVLPSFIDHLIDGLEQLE